MGDVPNHVHVGNSVRSEAYTTVLIKISDDAVCPFCPEHLAKYHTPPILKRGTYWLVTPNMYPYENAKHHFIFIAHRHVTDSKELTLGEWSELHELTQWLIAEYAIDCGTFLMRSGDAKKTGASVTHIHAHFVVGEDPAKPVITRVG